MRVRYFFERLLSQYPFDITMDTETITWIVVPSAAFGLLLYSSIAICAWPYARLLVPFWLFLMVLFVFPPFFPLLLVYVALWTCCFHPQPDPPSKPVVVVVNQQDASRRPLPQPIGARTMELARSRVPK